MGEIKYFRIKNWEKYQHPDCLRGNGPMKWVRIETAIFDDPKYWSLNAHQKHTWLSILLVAGKFRNRVPNNCKLLADIMHTVRLPNIDFMWDMGLIEPCDASNMQATCKQHASLEKRRAEKSRPEKKKATILTYNNDVVFDESEVRDLWEKYPKKAAGVLSFNEFQTEIIRHVPNRETFEALKSAIIKYANQTYDTDKKYLRNFRRFMADDYWRTYLEDKSHKKESPYVVRPAATNDSSPA